MQENCSKQHSFPVTKKGCFWNNHQEKPHGFLLDSIKMFFQSWQRRRNAPALNPTDWTHEAKPIASSEKPLITWIGHSTFLIQIGGINILTDPIFGDVSWLFPRIFPPGIALAQLHSIDYVLISHNHHDHMHAQSVHNLKKFDPLFCVPFGNKKWFTSNKINGVKEALWWEKNEIRLANGTLTITFLPAHHWSQRGIFDRNKTLWGSWLIEYNGFKIYFAGDTAYSNHFKEIGHEYGSIDIALMPVGPCNPRPHMRHSHIDAQEALKGFNDLAAHHFIPMHWGTFNFGIDHFAEPIDLLHKEWPTYQSKERQTALHVLKIGQSVQF